MASGRRSLVAAALVVLSCFLPGPPAAAAERGCIALALRFLEGERFLDADSLAALASALTAEVGSCVSVEQVDTLAEGRSAGADLDFLEFDPAWLPPPSALVRDGLESLWRAHQAEEIALPAGGTLGFFAFLPELRTTPKRFRARGRGQRPPAEFPSSAPSGRPLGFAVGCFLRGTPCVAIASPRWPPGGNRASARRSAVRDLAFQLAPYVLELIDSSQLGETAAGSDPERGGDLADVLARRAILDLDVARHALDALRRLPGKARQQAYLEPLKAPLRAPFRAMVTNLRAAGVRLPPWRELTRVDGAPGPRLFFRYDVHDRDILPALGLVGLHEEFGVPAAFYLMIDNGLEDLLLQPYFRLFGRYRSETIDLGLHASPLLSHFVVRRFGALPEPELVRVEQVEAAEPWNRLFSFEGEEIVLAGEGVDEETLEGAAERYRQMLATFETIFGPSRTVSSHGTPMLRDFRKRVDSSDRPLGEEAAETAELLNATNLLAFLRDEKGIGPRETTAICRDTPGFKCGFEGLGGRAMFAKLAGYLKAGRTVVQLLHPASFVDGRVDLGEWRPLSVAPQATGAGATGERTSGEGASD